MGGCPGTFTWVDPAKALVIGKPFFCFLFDYNNSLALADGVRTVVLQNDKMRYLFF